MARLQTGYHNIFRWERPTPLSIRYLQGELAPCVKPKEKQDAEPRRIPRKAC